jgi:hypothetical protein
MPDCWQAARMVWLSVLPILSVPSVLDDANDDPSCASQVVRLDLMQLTAAFAFTGSGCATSSMSKLDASWAVFGRVFCTWMRLVSADCSFQCDGRSWHACSCDKHGSV